MANERCTISGRYNHCIGKNEQAFLLLSFSRFFFKREASSEFPNIKLLMQIEQDPLSDAVVGKQRNNRPLLRA